MLNLLSFFINKAYAATDLALCQNFIDPWTGEHLADPATTTNAFTNCVATSSNFASRIASTLFTGFFDLTILILPYAIGILVFWIGYRLARRALGGN